MALSTGTLAAVLATCTGWVLVLYTVAYERGLRARKKLKNRLNSADSTAGLTTSLTTLLFAVPVALASTSYAVGNHVLNNWKLYGLAALLAGPAQLASLDGPAMLQFADQQVSQFVLPTYQALVLPVLNVFRIAYNVLECWLSVLLWLVSEFFFQLMYVFTNCLATDWANVANRLVDIPEATFEVAIDWVESRGNADLDSRPIVDRAADAFDALTGLFTCTCGDLDLFVALARDIARDPALAGAFFHATNTVVAAIRVPWLLFVDVLTETTTAFTCEATGAAGSQERLECKLAREPKFDRPTAHACQTLQEAGTWFDNSVQTLFHAFFDFTVGLPLQKRRVYAGSGGAGAFDPSDPFPSGVDLDALFNFTTPRVGDLVATVPCTVLKLVNQTVDVAFHLDLVFDSDMQGNYLLHVPLAQLVQESCANFTRGLDQVFRPLIENLAVAEGTVPGGTAWLPSPAAIWEALLDLVLAIVRALCEIVAFLTRLFFVTAFDWRAVFPLNVLPFLTDDAPYSGSKAEYYDRIGVELDAVVDALDDLASVISKSLGQFLSEVARFLRRVIDLLFEMMVRVANTDLDTWATDSPSFQDRYDDVRLARHRAEIALANAVRELSFATGTAGLECPLEPLPTTAADPVFSVLTAPAQPVCCGASLLQNLFGVYGLVVETALLGGVDVLLPPLLTLAQVIDRLAFVCAELERATLGFISGQVCWVTSFPYATEVGLGISGTGSCPSNSDDFSATIFTLLETWFRWLSFLPRVCNIVLRALGGLGCRASVPLFGSCIADYPLSDPFSDDEEAPCDIFREFYDMTFGYLADLMVVTARLFSCVIGGSMGPAAAAITTFTDAVETVFASSDLKAPNGGLVPQALCDFMELLSPLVKFFETVVQWLVDEAVPTRKRASCASGDVTKEFVCILEASLDAVVEVLKAAFQALVQIADLAIPCFRDLAISVITLDVVKFFDTLIGTCFAKFIEALASYILDQIAALLGIDNVKDAINHIIKVVNIIIDGVNLVFQGILKTIVSVINSAAKAISKLSLGSFNPRVRGSISAKIPNIPFLPLDGDSLDSNFTVVTPAQPVPEAESASSDVIEGEATASDAESTILDPLLDQFATTQQQAIIDYVEQELLEHAMDEDAHHAYNLTAFQIAGLAKRVAPALWHNSPARAELQRRAPSSAHRLWGTTQFRFAPDAVPRGVLERRLVDANELGDDDPAAPAYDADVDDSELDEESELARQVRPDQEPDVLEALAAARQQHADVFYAELRARYTDAEWAAIVRGIEAQLERTHPRLHDALVRMEPEERELLPPSVLFYDDSLDEHRLFRGAVAKQWHHEGFLRVVEGCEREAAHVRQLKQAAVDRHLDAAVGQVLVEQAERALDWCAARVGWVHTADHLTYMLLLNPYWNVTYRETNASLTETPQALLAELSFHWRQMQRYVFEDGGRLPPEPGIALVALHATRTAARYAAHQLATFAIRVAHLLFGEETLRAGGELLEQTWTALRDVAQLATDPERGLGQRTHPPLRSAQKRAAVWRQPAHRYLHSTERKRAVAESGAPAPTWLYDYHLRPIATALGLQPPHPHSVVATAGKRGRDDDDLDYEELDYDDRPVPDGVAEEPQPGLVTKTALAATHAWRSLRWRRDLALHRPAMLVDLVADRVAESRQQRFYERRYHRLGAPPSMSYADWHTQDPAAHRGVYATLHDELAPWRDGRLRPQDRTAEERVADLAAALRRRPPAFLPERMRRFDPEGFEDAIQLLAEAHFARTAPEYDFRYEAPHERCMQMHRAGLVKRASSCLTEAETENVTLGLEAIFGTDFNVNCDVLTRSIISAVDYVCNCIDKTKAEFSLELDYFAAAPSNVSSWRQYSTSYVTAAPKGDTEHVRACD